MKEDYVSFEVAKLLKEKGFDIPCKQAYFNGSLVDYTMYGFCDGELLDCPSQSLALKWLREVHKISIEITSTGYLIDNDVEWECDIKAGHRLYFKHITCEKSFESCAETAIKYCLENLI